MQIDPRQLRSCLGHFATGITVITCAVDGVPHGATVNAFTAVSLDPPLVLASLGRHTKTCEYLYDRPFTINLLASEQHDVAMHFAGRPADGGVSWLGADGETPRLQGCLAYIGCTPWRSYDGGDHVLHIGEVSEFEFHGGEPLLFYLGKFRHLGEPFGGVPWIESLDCPSGMSHINLLT